MSKLITIAFAIISFSSFSAGWVQQADFGGTARHRTPMITIGNKIYTGLGHYNGAGTNVLFNDWWQYDPASNTWSQKADYGGGICYHATGFTIGNFGYVGTGRVSAGGNTLVKSFYKYDPATNSWTQITDFPGAARRGAVSFVVGNYGYVGTGETNVSPYEVNDFYRYDPSTNSWSPIPNLPASGRSSAVAFSIGDYGYVGTGNTTSGASNDFWRYSPSTNSWTAMANVGPTPRQEATGFSLNGLGYIGTGDNFSSGTNYGDMWEFDPTSGVWTQIEDFYGSARRYLGSTSFNGKGYAGLGTNGTNFKDFWMYDQFLSLHERGKLEVEINAYPNPVVNELNIDLVGLEGFNISEFSIQIVDLNGRVLLTEKLVDVNASMDLSQLSSGNYQYVLNYNSQAIQSGSIIKQ